MRPAYGGLLSAYVKLDPLRKRRLPGWPGEAFFSSSCVSSLATSMSEQASSSSDRKEELLGERWESDRARLLEGESDRASSLACRTSITFSFSCSSLRSLLGEGGQQVKSGSPDQLVLIGPHGKSHRSQGNIPAENNGSDPSLIRVGWGAGGAQREGIAIATQGTGHTIPED